MVVGAVVPLIARGLSHAPDCPILGPKWDSSDIAPCLPQAPWFAVGSPPTSELAAMPLSFSAELLRATCMFADATLYTRSIPVLVTRARRPSLLREIKPPSALSNRPRLGCSLA